MQRKFKHLIVYCFTRIGIFIWSFTPKALIKKAGVCIGLLAYWIAAKERHIAHQQLVEALHLKIKSKRSSLITKGVFIQLGISAMEICKLLHAKNYQPSVSLPPLSKQTLDTALSLGHGVIFATGHLGNWELMAITLAQMGYPIFTVAKKSSNIYFDGLISQKRAQHHVNAIYRETNGSSAKMLRTLKQGKILGLLIDQDTRVPSVFVPFFGKSAHTPVGAATLAHRTGAIIVVGSIHRNGKNKHTIRISKCPLQTTEKETTAGITQQLEAQIKKHPTQWVWFHRRWKTQEDNA